MQVVTDGYYDDVIRKNTQMSGLSMLKRDGGSYYRSSEEDESLMNFTENLLKKQRGPQVRKAKATFVKRGKRIHGLD